MPTVGLLYERGQPTEAALAAALARRCRLRVCTAEHLPRLASWLTHGPPPDPLRPPALPLVPHFRWRGGLQRPLLRWFVRGSDAVILTRIEHAPLLPALRGKRRIALLFDDDTDYGRSARDERILVEGCDAIMAVSSELIDRIRRRTGAGADKFHLVPNGVDDDAVPLSPPAAPVAQSADSTNPRPLAGVLGGVSPGRLRLDWVEECIDRVPWLHWLFAGRIEWRSLSDSERAAMRRIAQHARCRILEPDSTVSRWSSPNPQRLYSPMLDVAIIPYADHPGTTAACPARLYFHLAQGTPVLATSACPHLHTHGRLVTRCDSPAEFVAALTQLHSRQFDDGLRRARWETATQNTTTRRAEAILRIIGDLLPA